MTGQARSPRRPIAPGRWFACLLAVAALVVGVLVPTAGATAAPATASMARAASDPVAGIKPMTLAGFDPGHLISDAVFTDKNSMSEAQIQSFFNGKVATCRGGTDEDGRQVVCLKDFKISSVNRPADSYCQGYTGAANETAARIIYRVAQSCGINPQVLIVMLQKEQGLVTHSWPSAWRYDIALGQGCPDDAPCNPDFVGFFHQIYGAARQMQVYMEGKYFTWFAPGKTWNIRYSPNIACGSGPVYVANKATSAMYYYTPYQPNAAALAAGTGEAPCGAYGNRNFYNYFTDWFGPTRAANPFGNIEMVEARPGQFAVSGWAIDPNTTEPIAVHVYAGSAGSAFLANVSRPDVGAAYPGSGDRHGFSVTVPAVGAGATDVCVYAMNSGAGANVLLGCRSVTAKSGSPVGSVPTAKAVSGGVKVTGWALDPDTVSPATVHVYVDSVGVAASANLARTDIPAAYVAYGKNHGFDVTVNAAAGSHNVCVYGINSGPGGNVQLGCSVVQVGPTTITEKGRVPVGAFESVAVSGNVATATGWALDPDTASSIKVHLYVGSAGKEYSADKVRADVAAANPGYGDRHGFSEALTLPVGKSTVCAYGINTGPGGHVLLGCKEATVAAQTTDRGRVPFGNFEGVAVEAGAVVVGGWAIDPDTTNPISVHIYVDSTSSAHWADKERADVAGAYPGTGSKHGFSERLSTSAGTHNVCVYAINDGAGGHVLLGCKTVTVP
ncbi:hypothetical protein LTA6_003680 [Microbacterium sp. LTA6]|uniref:hypothetical protein n=1 Tax=unclassified Microbacterium TaxID=2609290 RepID=UPI003139595A